MSGVLLKRGDLGTETCVQGGHYVKMKAEIRVMLQQTKEH